MKGKIVRLTQAKYGFIKGEDGQDYFFHREDFSGFWDDLLHDFNQGPIGVNFDPTMGPKGLRAESVNRLDFPNQ